MLNQEELEQQTLEAFLAWRKDVVEIEFSSDGKEWNTDRSPSWAAKLFYRLKPEPIPAGVFYLEGPSHIEGIRTTNSFIGADGKCLYRKHFDYEKWHPRRNEFPAL